MGWESRINTYAHGITPKYNYIPEVTEISEPALNTVTTVYVGDSLVRQGKFSVHDAIYIRQDVKIGTVGSYTLTRGYYLKEGEDEKAEYYLPAGGPDSGRVVKSAFADPFQVIRRDKNTGKLCGVSAFNMQTCTDEAAYEQKTYPVASADSFQQTLIYSGMVGNKINIGYREFSNDFARPAFNNEVEYDLSQSRTIAYKGCKIEVIEATNEFIKYKVLSNFNKAAF